MASSNPTAALLCIWHDVEAGFVDEYLRWHTFEHLPERLALPGFVSAERYELREGPGQRFCCFIDVDGLDALQSPAYQARLDAPTEWTRRLMPRYARVHRALCGKRREIGAGTSHRIACLRVASGGDSALACDLSAACTVWHARHHALRARLAALDPVTTGRHSEEKRLRRSEDAGGYDLVLLVDALSQQSLRLMVGELDGLMAARGSAYELSTYDLSCVMRGGGLDGSAGAARP